MPGERERGGVFRKIKNIKNPSQESRKTKAAARGSGTDGNVPHVGSAAHGKASAGSGSHVMSGYGSAAHGRAGSGSGGHAGIRTASAARASVTVEAAAVLPLFFMAVITLAMFMEALRLQGKSSIQLSNQARKASVAAAVAGGAADGLYIDFFRQKSFQYPFGLFGIPDLRIAVRARVYPWVGCEAGSLGGGGTAASEETVIVTENQSVYHTDPDCTHIDLAVIRTPVSQVGKRRNAYGRKYRPCSGFPSGYTGDVYVTEKGDYYYPSTAYGSLTRHVRIVRQSEVSGLKECSRCAAKR